MMLMLALATVVSALFYLLVRLDETQRMSPDGAFYVAVAKGEPTPRPYCFRWLWPLACNKRIMAWQIMSAVSLIAWGPLVAWFARIHGLSGVQCVAAAALLCGLPGFFRVNVLLPVLVDPPAFALALLSACLTLEGHPAWGVAAALLCGASKEAGPIFAAAFCLSPWPLLGLLAAGWWRKAGLIPPGTPWLARPVAEALRVHRGHWLGWADMVLPWGAIPVMLFFCQPAPALVAGVVLSLALGYGQMLRSQDRARLFGWAAPPLIVLALTGIAGAPALALACVAHLYNPCRGI